MPDLEPIFLDLVCRHGAGGAPAQALWAELRQAYSGPSRHYHTLAHLAAMWAELAPHQARLTDADALLFALFYHDAVYEVGRSDNEERSAELAAARLAGLPAVPAGRAARCERQILATKRHEPSGEPDTDLLLDADLAVLGQPWPAYQAYARQVRAEYRRYPDLLYKPGRRKVLRQFLGRPRLYQTAPFFERYEAAARANLTRELREL